MSSKNVKRIPAIVLAVLTVAVLTIACSPSVSAARNVPVASVGVKSSLKLSTGKTYTLKATVRPTNSTDKRVKFTSSNTAVASVNSSTGLIKAKKQGTTTITVASRQNPKIKAKCKVNVSDVRVKSVRLNKTKATLEVGKTLKLKETVLPAGATKKTVTFKSLSPKVASVTSDGRVKALSPGSARIRVTTNDGGKKAYCDITVTPKVVKVKGVSLNRSELTLKVGESFGLEATVTPAGASNKSISWASSKIEVATVDSKGTVNAKAPGETTVTAVTDDGEFKASCTVTVVQNDPPAEDKNKIELKVGDKIFDATLNDGPAAQKLLQTLPLTLDMSELNGNEKYYYMDQSLPTDASSPGQIHTGDIMLYGDSCLVVFYKDFPTSYSYTPLGKVDDTTGLAETLGGDDVTVEFRLK